MIKVGFTTLGCKVNQYETESMMAQFEGSGYRVVAFQDTADIYVVNTCTVTNMADKKSRQMLSKAKKNNNKAIVVAVGCYVQTGSNALDRLDNIDLLVGNTDKGRIVEIVEKYLQQQITPDLVDLTKYQTYDDLWLSHKSTHTRVHVKIQDGCDQFCAYCIIPFARGRIRSRDPESIIKEIMDLVEQGYKEVVLTGIHLASYGRQFDQYELIDLLEELDKIHGLERIRLGSLEPTLVTKEFMTRLSSLTKICEHFHLSMQSGDDEILRAMNRKYTTIDYKSAVDLIRRVYPNAGITTDLIVGFPGETEEHFSNTLQFLKEIQFSDVHVFKYSKRDGTKAAAMSGQISGTTKQKRSHEAMEVIEVMKKSYLEKMLGTVQEILIEEQSDGEHGDYYMGHTSNYVKVYIPARHSIEVNSTVKAKGIKLFRDGVVGGVLKLKG